MKISVTGIFWIKVLIHSGVIITSFYLWYLVDQDLLGADPVKEMIHFMGKTALNFLLLTLMITPLIKIAKQPLLIRLRRLLGLYSFVWACLHVLVLLSLELSWQFAFFVDEVLKRPYLSLGMIAWIILLLLAVTSINRLKKRMKKAWFSLHRLVYLAVFLASIHYYWSVKSGLIEPTIYLLICLLLLAYRKNYFKKLWLKKIR